MKAFKCFVCRRWVERGTLVKIKLGEVAHVGCLVKTCKAAGCRKRAEQEIFRVIWKKGKAAGT